MQHQAVTPRTRSLAYAVLWDLQGWWLSSFMASKANEDVTKFTYGLFSIVSGGWKGRQDYGYCFQQVRILETEVVKIIFQKLQIFSFLTLLCCIVH